MLKRYAIDQTDNRLPVPFTPTALASFKRIKYILNLEKEKIVGKELKYIDSIVFKNVSFAYDSKIDFIIL